MRSPGLAADSFVCALRDAFDDRLVGGKARNLARLFALDAPVPDGVVLTSRAFDAFVAALDNPPGGRDENELSHVMRDLVMAAPMPDEVEHVLNAIAAEWLGLGPLAVRSSVVGEDGVESSFAGQFDSVLDVTTTGALQSAVRTCWASYWSARAMFYRRSRQIPAVGMGVVIQRQVDATVAGVLFTRNPGDRGGGGEMVIEYCAGLADRLVSGEVDPVRLTVSRLTCEVIREEAPDSTFPVTALLTAQQVADLGRLALRLERDLDGPQDIEWAVGTDGAIAIVQSRRITTIVSSQGVRADAPTVLWSNANVSENFPQPVCPLLYSIACTGYYHYFRNLGLTFGVSRPRLRAMDTALRTIIGAHGARMYYNLTNIHAVLRMAPCGDQLATAFNLFVGVDQTAAQPVGAIGWRDRAGRVTQAFELVRIAVAVTWQYLFLGRRLRRFEREADRFAERTAPEALRQRSLAGLGADLAAFMDIRRYRWKDASLCDTAAMVMYALLQRMLARNGFDAATHTQLLRALPGVPSSQPVLRLWALSREIRADRALLDIFLRAPADRILTTLDTDERFAGFRASFETYLRQWGFRSSSELMLTVPALDEEPGPVIELLRQYVQTEGASPEESIARQAAARRAQTMSVLRTVARRAPLQAPLVWLCVRWAQRSVAYRERARLKQALLYTRCRRVALRVGEELTRRGRVAAREDVFLLTWQELDELCAGRSMFPRGVGDLVAMRRRQHQRESALTPPDTLRLAESEAFTATATAAVHEPEVVDAASGVLAGTTACGGRVTAPAAVLAGVQEADRLRRGDVIVTRQTDPGWGPLFGLASGLVIERGGMLSHGAIIAREFGLPCVVGVKNATTRITHGSMVTVDGDRGACHVDVA